MSIKIKQGNLPRKQEEEKHLGIVADELDSMAGVDGGGAEPALLQPHGASFLGTVLRAPNRQNKRVW